ncbi:MAG: hypothetical protein H6670_11030 [Anaerolineaceae bacterium]|nr:hypothetical protein [Anaerolineaceae bacterium]
MTEQANDTQPRIFKTGSTTITEDESTSGLTAEQVRDVLKYQFPEVANATINTRTTEDGQEIIEFLPKPGRKG